MGECGWGVGVTVSRWMWMDGGHEEAGCESGMSVSFKSHLVFLRDRLKVEAAEKSRSPSRHPRERW